MSWSQIFLRGARRLADRRTYVIVVAGGVLAAVPPAVVAALAGKDPATLLVALGLAFIWAWLLVVYTWGALSIAATEQPSHERAGAVLRAAWARYGSFLGAAAIILAGGIVIVFALTIVALIGKGGTTTAPILAVLTPVFLAGGIAVFLLTLLARLTFAVIAVEGGPATLAVRRAWQVMRRRTSETILWLAVDTAIVGGVFWAVIVPVVAGGASGLSIEVRFYGREAFESIFEGTVDVAGAVIGAIVWTLIVGTFALLVLGALASFSIGSAVGYYQAVGASVQAVGRPGGVPAVQPFCDQCGSPRSPGSGFCDACGAVLALA